jgi:hypothetical protein
MPLVHVSHVHITLLLLFISRGLGKECKLFPFQEPFHLDIGDVKVSS